MNADGCRPPRRGFSLIELLVVMAVMSTIMMTMVLLAWATIRLERTDAAVFRRVLEQSSLADEFRADVAQSERTLDKWQDFRAGPTCLVLEQKGRHVVYAWDKARLVRITFAGAKRTEVVLPVGLEPAQANVEFARPGPDLCVLRLAKEPVRQGVGFTIEIAAALGGERR